MLSHATHQQTLLRAVLQSDGPILEMGAGWYSTPILHEVATALKRPLLTIEHNQYWFDRFGTMANDFHRLQKVATYDDFKPTGRYAVAFIDHAPAERRIIDIARLMPYVDLFVIHDTESPEYNYESVWPMLDIIDTDKTFQQWTTTARPRK